MCFHGYVFPWLCCLLNGLLTNDWKIGHITPIFKKRNVDNYHPPCIASVITKLLESVVKVVSCPAGLALMRISASPVGHKTIVKDALLSSA